MGNTSILAKDNLPEVVTPRRSKSDRRLWNKCEDSRPGLSTAVTGEQRSIAQEIR